MIIAGLLLFAAVTGAQMLLAQTVEDKLVQLARVKATTRFGNVR